jgi:hypothetical protein
MGVVMNPIHPLHNPLSRRKYRKQFGCECPTNEVEVVRDVSTRLPDTLQIPVQLCHALYALGSNSDQCSWLRSPGRVWPIWRIVTDLPKACRKPRHQHPRPLLCIGLPTETCTFEAFIRRLCYPQRKKTNRAADLQRDWGSHLGKFCCRIGVSASAEIPFGNGAPYPGAAQARSPRKAPTAIFFEPSNY